MKSDRYDTIVIGAGHNGLVCAAYLARHGQRVLVLEASDVPGGLAATREFHPGFQASVAHSISHFSHKVASDLKLQSHGFDVPSKPLPTIGLNTDGEHVVVHQDSLSGVADEDVNSYRKYALQMQRFADVLKPFWQKTMPRIGMNSVAEMMTFAHIGLNLRRIGKQDMQEFLRIVSLPTRDLMDENFNNDILKAILSWDGLIGSKMAPRSPNGSVLAMLYRRSSDNNGAHIIPSGGIGGLIKALCSSASASGVEIQTGAAVGRILIAGSAKGLIVTGVQLADGGKLDAERVISAVDPKKTFIDLVGVENLDIGFTNRIRRLRCNGYVAKLHLALSELPEFDGLEKPDGRMIIAPDMDTIEFAFDHAKYGECPTQPVIELVIPSVHDASLAPDGQHVLSAHVMYVPYQLKGGWNSQVRDALCERVIDTIARYAPRLREQIIHKELLTPADLEQQHRVTGGHWHHAELAMDQILMMRPTYEAAQYSTPIPGLYLCGAGSHPGGDITGAAGHNAAHEILR
jgi:phytoene dehydrogenase-like protein